MKITLRQLSYFKALAEHRNFGRAALSCNVSQPALSVQIRELEAHLGGPLVERHARGVVLTPFGRQALHHAESMLREAEALERAARWREGLAGHLSLGVIPTVAPYLLPDALAALRTRDISLDLYVREGKTAVLLAMLQSGALDAVVMALPAEVDGLTAEPLFEDRFLLAGTPERVAALAGGDSVLRPTGLEAHQLLLLEDGHCLTDQALDVCGRGRGHAQIDMGASSLATLSRLVAAGFGLTLMPELAAPVEATATPGLALHRFGAPEPARQIGLVRRRGSFDDGWFSELAGVLREVGAALVERTRDVARKSA
ncbi:LysR family transcriptional regulator, hydrogen peroxide-inducible genes activator [Salinihabitans flavidus]|uniref:LysR family transcriptional regulator, hydrogen peroxide-inducible genes activator n=1 Tax=Salinihabitans flavidus TaxID=569882 RepID=A0A1H8ND16_9RHOB|nr:LysR substrate-binding domain-containing protein [Salinihabitans flavidus]SEO27349.1 LysR family transcriptional regulator, hydrogen peroxide-inducible genes activator [Salinihabitans flavidus]